MIYFAQSLDGGPVKIGCSGDVEARLKQLEIHYGRPLSLLATMEGDREKETEIHQRFAHLRFGRTEQFRPAPELMAFIGRPLLVGANPDTVEAMTGKQPAPGKTVGIRATGEWAAWVERFARYHRTDVAKLVDKALLELAERTGFDEPPLERIP